MMALLIVTWIGNLIDYVSTIYLIGKGYTEANPIMAALIPHPILFATVKIGAMSLVLWILWRYRESKYARVVAWIGAVLYSLVSVYYLLFLAL